MHRKTFERLKKKARMAERRSFMGLYTKLVNNGFWERDPFLEAIDEFLESMMEPEREAPI